MSPDDREVVSPLASDADGRIHIPDDHGILIILQNDGSVFIETVTDAYYPLIHPNCYAPSGLEELFLLKGGGSGTAVFAAKDPQFGSLVMKHAGPKDTIEIFSLVKVADELIQRRSFAPDAVDFLKQRIPEFQYAYLSPLQLRDRKKEKWMKLRKYFKFLLRRLSGSFSSNKSVSTASLSSTASDGDNNNNGTSQAETNKVSDMGAIVESISEDAIPNKVRRPSLLANMPRLRSISVMAEQETCKTTSPSFVVTDDSVDILVPGLQPNGYVRHGIQFMNAFAKQLSSEQKINRWKVTLAQKTIGGPNSENGAFVMTQGRLHGPLLRKLITEFTKVLQCLKEITRIEEKHVVHALREDLHLLRESNDVTMVSKEMDAYVGNCIIKNYHPVDGRFTKLRKYGRLFREKSNRLYLTPDEASPAMLLGLILERGATLDRVFVQPPPGRFCALDTAEDHWLTVIEFAAAVENIPAATDCIWTCGLTDAGLHNCFVSEDRLELFDLGEPKFTPQPAFLTKFLMSIFHVYGMEENLEKVGGTGWVHRFHIADDGRLQLNPGMEDKIEYMFQVYHEATDCFLETLFNGEQQIGRLLASYAVLQLLSDAGFCLDRWEEKGGGSKHEERSSFEFSHKWLWRAIWDIYIASFVYHRLVPDAPN